VSDDKSEIKPLLITGLLAIAGTVVGGVVTGLVEANLAAQKFQSDLIVKALEPPDEVNRVSNLGFLLQAGLVSNKELRDGLSRVLKDPARNVPQFQTPQQLVTSSKDRRIGGDTSRYTDIKVLACSSKEKDPLTGRILSDVITRLANSEKIGRITPAIAEASSTYDSISVAGKTIVAVDPGHPEAEDAKRIVALLRGLPDLPPLEQRYVPPSAPSPWQLEVIICPK
jgi:hypothetical protein